MTRLPLAILALVRLLPVLARSRAGAPAVHDERDFKPVAIVEVELSAPLAAIPATDPDGRPHGGARVLVRLHTRTIGWLQIGVPDEGLQPAALASAIWDAVAVKVNAHLRADGLAEVDRLPADGLPATTSPRCVLEREALLRNAPKASVIVCTRNRPDVLRRSLQAIDALDYPDVEPIVVDGSSGSGTADLIRDEFAHVKYLHIGSNGIAVARNRGAAAATGYVAAYTDDDGVVDRHWLSELVLTLTSDPSTACATGLVLPLELNTRAQLWFEESGAFTEGLERRRVSLDMARGRGSLLPWATGKIGAGVSMAWKASVIRDVGFDASLDTLTPVLPLRSRHASSAEDLAAFFDVLVRGFSIVFTPDAVVYHEHRRTQEELARQLYWHGLGLSAYLTRCILRRPAQIPDFVRRVPRGLLYGFASGSVRNKGKSADFPSALTRAEQRGVAAGPFAYLRGLPRARKVLAAERLAAASGASTNGTASAAAELVEPGRHGS